MPVLININHLTMLTTTHVGVNEKLKKLRLQTSLKNLVLVLYLMLMLLMFFAGRYAVTKAEVDKESALQYLRGLGILIGVIILSYFKPIMLYPLLTIGISYHITMQYLKEYAMV
jgi:hypothetical protein